MNLKDEMKNGVELGEMLRATDLRIYNAKRRVVNVEEFNKRKAEGPDAVKRYIENLRKTPHRIVYIDRSGGPALETEIIANDNISAVWEFMQTHDPEKYKILYVYKIILSPIGAGNYNKIGRDRIRKRLEALPRTPEVQEQLNALHREEINGSFGSPNYYTFQDDFKWIIEPANKKSSPK